MMIVRELLNRALVSVATQKTIVLDFMCNFVRVSSV